MGSKADAQSKDQQTRQIQRDNAAESDLDQQRRAFEAERSKEGKEVDRKAIRYARDHFNSDLAKNDASEVQQRYRSLRSIGGYRVEGGFLEVFTRFRAHPELQKKEKTDPARDDEQKDEEIEVVEDKKEDKKKSSIGSQKPKEPAHPPPERLLKATPKPKSASNPHPTINPPPPAVDIYKGSSRCLACSQCLCIILGTCHSYNALCLQASLWP